MTAPWHPRSLDDVADDPDRMRHLCAEDFDTPLPSWREIAFCSALGGGFILFLQWLDVASKANGQ